MDGGYTKSESEFNAALANIDPAPPDASDVAFTPGITGMESDNVQDAIEELFTSVSDGKSAIAAAVTDKGIETAATDSFAEIADKIGDIETGIQLPTLTNPGTAADLALGKQLIDQNGEIVTGTIMEYLKGNFVLSNGTPYMGETGTGVPTIGIQETLSFDMLGRKDKLGIVSCPASNFGNATAADVAYGKTFTSTAGVAVAGTGQFLKFGLFQYTGYGSANTSIPSYPTSSYPVAIFITMNDTIPYADNTVFQMSVVGLTGCISGANFVRSDEVSRGTYASDKISLVLDSASNELLIYTPNASSGGFITFESGKPYSIYYFYN